jgi:hypothetical protein
MLHDARNLVAAQAASSVPILVLHVVGKNDPSHLAVFRESDLERISLGVSRGRASDGKTSLRIVSAR